MVDRYLPPPSEDELRRLGYENGLTECQKTERLLEAQAIARHQAEERAAPLRAAAEINRQENEAIRRDEREERLRERGY